jgi:hypothetical protein
MIALVVCAFNGVPRIFYLLSFNLVQDNWFCEALRKDDQS